MSFLNPLLLIACLVFGGCATSLQDHIPIQDNAVSCTQELLVCNDGTMVGRLGPQCAFAPCADGSEPRPEVIVSDETIVSPVPLSAQLACEGQGGRRSTTYKECTDIPARSCTVLGGVYDSCASSCRHDPEAEMCTKECVQVCQL